MPSPFRSVVSVVAVFSVVLSGCGAALHRLPEGVQTMTGVLKTAELSRLRRGTHVLEQEGKAVYFVESGERNLRSFENKEVTAVGTLEPNTDRKALPVFVVSDIQSRDIATRTWKIPSLGITLEAPEDWQGYSSGSGMTFRFSGKSAALLNVRLSPLTTLPSGGQPVLIGTAQGRIVSDSDNHTSTAYVLAGGKVIVFQFSPPIDAVSAYLDDYFTDMLRSVQFTRTFSSSPAVSSGTGAMTGTGSQTGGKTCGGAAGFVCPAGQYCEITDGANNIGVCKKL